MAAKCLDADQDEIARQPRSIGTHPKAALFVEKLLIELRT
jgi:hypothetical protein